MNPRVPKQNSNTLPSTSELQLSDGFERLVTNIATHFINFDPAEFDGRVHQALGMLGEFVGSDRSYLFLLDEEGARISNTHEWCAPGIAPTIQDNQQLTLTDFAWYAKQLLNNQAVSIARAEELPPEAATERAFMATAEAKSLLLVPLFYQNEAFGLIGFDAVKAEKSWPNSHQTFLKIVGEIIAHALQHNRIEKALRESEEKYRRLAEALPVTIGVYQDNRCVFGNRAMLEMFGYRDLEEMLGRDVFSWLAKVDFERMSKMAAARAAGEPDVPDHFFLSLKRCDGDEFPAEVFISQTVFNGEPAFQAIVLDITEKKQQEEKLRLTLQRQHMLNQILDFSMQLPEISLREVLDRTLEILAEIPWLGLGYKGVIFLVEQEPRVLILKANRNLEPQLVLDRARVDFGDGCCGEAAARREIIHIREHKDAPAPELCNFASCHVPMIASGTVIGVLSLLYDPKEPEDEQRMPFLEALGNTLAVMIRHKQAEDELRASEARVRAIVSNVLDGIITIDTQGHLESCNPAAAAIFGFSPAELAGQPLALLLPEVRQADSIAEYLQRLGGQVAREFVAERRTGESFPLELAVSEMRLGRRLLYVGILRDISARKRVEQELIKSKEAAEAANEAKSLFLATMSHELRTPLNSVIGFANILRKNESGNLDSRQIDCLSRVLSNARHLFELINDVLDLSKIEAGKAEVVTASVALAPLIGEILEQYAADSSAKLNFHRRIPPKLKPITADSTKLRQILNNLVSNAAKFTEEGSVTVAVHADKERRPVRIEVIDTGIGIPKQMHDKIFDAFMQADSGAARKYPGTGLGLKIARGLCQVLGYSLTVDSEPGKGSTFSIHLQGESQKRAKQRR